MNISVGKTTKKHDRKILKRAAEYYLSELIDKKTRKKLTINIKLVDKPLQKHVDEKMIVLGFCRPITFASTPRKFLIRLNKHENLDSVLSTLAHELVHVKQYASGKLRPVDWDFLTDVYKWRGKIRDIPYYTSPWEVEARHWEKILYRQFKKQLTE